MLHLGSIRGTTIDVDFNFTFLVLLFVVLNYNEQLGIHYALLWIPILFLSVLVHELAHAAMIGIFGFGSSNIVLTGMGGVTINRRKAKAWQDLLISLAGPLSSFGLMFLCELVWNYVAIAQTDKMLAALLPRMHRANYLWALFNLIPVPPLDGGHATREFFRTFLDERPAFLISIWIAIIGGAAIAAYLVFVEKEPIVGIYIAFFVYMAFQQWQQFKETGVPS